MKSTATLRSVLLELSKYGMLLITLLLCVLFSLFTRPAIQREGNDAGEALAHAILASQPVGAKVAVVTQSREQDQELLAALKSALEAGGMTIVGTAQGTPDEAEKMLQDLAARGAEINVLACSRTAAYWKPIRERLDSGDQLSAAWERLGNPQVIAPPPRYGWPTFLTVSNAKNIAIMVSVTAIIAIGMTMVIITGGIDLSVGSIVALSAVICTLLIRDGIPRYSLFGVENLLRGVPWRVFWLIAIFVAGLFSLAIRQLATKPRLPTIFVTLSCLLIALAVFGSGKPILGGSLEATPATMVLSSLIAVSICGLFGLTTGLLVTTCRLPAFIVTLSFMLIARGIAKWLTKSESVYQIPPSFMWLDGGTSLGVSNCVLLMFLLYAVAFVLMHYAVLGRYLYAVGGNMEAARLSGVPVFRVVIFAYVLCSILAGVGGIVEASRSKSGSANFGEMYELQVIAAVVVGGTSIAGGEGKILGTLVGAFMITIIKSGMNQCGIKDDQQPIVLGLVILGAVLLDKLKQWLIRRSNVAGQ